MCNHLFLAADCALPILAWNEERPSVDLSEATDAEIAAVRGWLTRPFVYCAGSHMGCACPFSCEPNLENPTEEDVREWRASRDDFRQLAAYLTQAAALAGPLAIYNAWDYWEAPLLRRSISALDLIEDSFVFQERELLTVQPAEYCLRPGRAA